MTPEAKVKRKVKEFLRSVGAYYTMPQGTGMSSSGVPDFLVCKDGLFYGIECKANKNKPTALQLKHLDDIRKAGGVAFVVDETNVETLRKELLSYVNAYSLASNPSSDLHPPNLNLWLRNDSGSANVLLHSAHVRIFAMWILISTVVIALMMLTLPIIYLVNLLKDFRDRNLT